MNDEVCQGVVPWYKPCGRQVYRDKKCIFHLENKSNDEAKIFETAFWNEMEKMEKNNDIEELDFAGFIFPVRISFDGHSFYKPVNFSGSKFNNKASFLDTKFNDEANFSDAKFNNEADFSDAKFNVANFNHSEFHGVASFAYAQFPISRKDFFMISFIEVKFYKPNNVRFQNNDLSYVSFLNTDITEVEFSDVKWARKNGRLAVTDEFYFGRISFVTYGAVAQLYRRLRKNYETNYRFSEAGDFFIGEMEMRRRDVKTKFTNKIVLWFKRNFSLLGLYKHICLYGESYYRPAILAIIIIISYPMLMHWLLDASLPQSGYAYLRTSAASFFQMESTYIGERIIGALLLGLLFIALKRQFERKK